MNKKNLSLATSLSLSILFFSTGLRATDEAKSCPSPVICNEVNAQYEKSMDKPKSKNEFRKFVALLRTTIKKDCRIEGVQVPVPIYRACYDQGFSTKVGADGQAVVDKSLKGPVAEDRVLSWFNFAKNSKFPEGKKLIRNKEFQSTLDGYWAESFSR